MILLDTNVLVYAVNVDSPEHRASRLLVEAGLAGELGLVLVPQILLEAYAILTDGRRVAQPLQPVQAWAVIDAYRAALPVLDFPAKALDTFADVVSAQRTVGQDVFDAVLVGQMRFHGIGTLCTFNAADFRRYPGISAEAPNVLLRRHRVPRPRDGGPKEGEGG